MPRFLNQEFGFDEVRWATARKTSYDSRQSFSGAATKVLLPTGTTLFRLVHLVNGQYFDQVWWMPGAEFDRLRGRANQLAGPAGAQLRESIAEHFALPHGGTQLCVVEIQLTMPVFAWEGKSSPLFERPGGMTQIYLPNLADRGDPRTSSHAKVVHTFWLRF